MFHCFVKYWPNNQFISIIEGNQVKCWLQPGGSSSARLYLKQGEAQVVLKQDTANAPHVTGMAPAQL